MITGTALSEMVKDYLECALFAETDESNDSGGDPLDQNYDIDDFSAEAISKAKTDCRAFLRDAAPLLRQLLDAGTLKSAGHDLWLTRNGHGAGFWDRGYPDEIGKELSKIAEAMGNVNAYVGDEKLVHLS